MSQSTLSIQRGQLPNASVASKNILGGGAGGAQQILSAGKSSSGGSSAFSSGSANQLLGASGGGSIFGVANASTTSLTAIQTEIMAERESVPESQLGRNVNISA